MRTKTKMRTMKTIMKMKAMQRKASSSSQKIKRKKVPNQSWHKEKSRKERWMILQKKSAMC
jgi:hypothetical protein